MYTITISNVEIAVIDRPTYIRLQSNGVFGLCSREQAQGVAYESTPYHVEGMPAIDREGVETVVLTEIDGGRRLMQTDKHVAVLSAAGVKQIQVYCASGNAPSADSGVFVDGAEAWEAGKSYERGEAFAYNGAMGYVKQAHTSQDIWLPFTAGTEALYGARPAPDENDIIPMCITWRRTWACACVIQMIIWCISAFKRSPICYTNRMKSRLISPSRPIHRRCKIMNEKALKIIEAAKSQLGNPYVFGMWGRECTPSVRRQYAGYNPSHKSAIFKACPVLSGKQPSCDGCKWQGKLAFDCRGFTYWCLSQVGITIKGGGATSQYNTAANWVQRGDIGDMPDVVCCVFQRRNGRMQHTGLHIGGAR